jgi:hypothetical protein
MQVGDVMNVKVIEVGPRKDKPGFRIGVSRKALSADTRTPQEKKGDGGARRSGGKSSRGGRDRDRDRNRKSPQKGRKNPPKNNDRLGTLGELMLEALSKEKSKD